MRTRNASNRSPLARLGFGIIVAFLSVACGSDKEEGTAPEDICSDPCDVVSFQGGINITFDDCMGARLDSEDDRDQFGRPIRVLVTFENGSIEIDDVVYNNLGQPLSFTAVRRHNSDVLTRDFEFTYNSSNQLERIDCT